VQYVEEEVFNFVLDIKCIAWVGSLSGLLGNVNPTQLG